MKNIQKEVTGYIDNNITVRRGLKEGIVNIRALARKINSEGKLGSIDSIISAIRRYEDRFESKNHGNAISKLLQRAKLSSKTRLASILLRNSPSTRNRLAQIFQLIDFEAGDTLRIFEVTKYIKLITDDKYVPQIKKIFTQNEVILSEKDIGELAISYDEDITKTPGLFAAVSNEMALNDISIVDSMICYNEHIVIVNEADIRRTFDVIYSLLSRKI